MNPSEQLKEIEARLQQVGRLHEPYASWLINRVKVLTNTLEDLTYECDHDISLGERTTESFLKAREILRGDG